MVEGRAMKCRLTLLVLAVAVVGAPTSILAGASAPAPPPKQDEPARLEREREEAELREALRRTADRFLKEAAATALQPQSMVERTDVLYDIALAHLRADDCIAARKVAIAMKPGYKQRGILQSALYGQIKNGDFEEGGKTLRIWKDRMTEQVEGLAARPSWWRMVGRLQGKLGDRDAAQETLRHAVALARESRRSDKRDAELLDLAGAQADVGDVGGVRTTLALSQSRRRDEVGPYIFARAQMKAGDFAGARRTAATLATKHGPAVMVWKQISEAQAEAGDFAGAVATGKASGALDGANHARLAIVRAQIKAGEFLAAKSTVAEMGGSSYRRRGLIAIARAQVQAGDLAAARLTTDATEHADWRAEFYLVRAAALRSAEAFADARDAAAVIRPPGQRAHACLLVARAQLAAGQRAGLDRILEVVEPAAEQVKVSFYYYASIRLGLAELFAEVGDLPAAKKTLRDTVPVAATIKYVSHRGRRPSPDNLLRYVELRDGLRTACGMQQAGIGDLAGARATLEVIEGAAARAMVLLKIAEAQRAAGNEDAATKTIAEATAATAMCGKVSKSAKHVQGSIIGFSFLNRVAVAAIAQEHADADVPFSRSMLYLEIADMRSRLGDVAGARDAAAKAGVGPLSVTAYARIAVAHIRAGDAKTARAIVSEVEDPERQERVRVGMAVSLARAGEFAEARALAAKPYGLTYRARACRRIAKAYGERGDAAAILAWAQQEPSAQSRINILLGGAEGLRVMAESANPSFVPPTATPPASATPAPDQQ
jgi:hypothetical protein